jgi:exodeoxyribonuclease V alpha subunit
MLANKDDCDVLAGLVERVTFHNEENGFCVLRVKARGQRDLITVLGHAAAISAGEWVTASGSWQNDRTHGLQFRARFLKSSAPTTVEGIEKYLASGMVRGIGPVYAKRLIKAFGDKVFEIIENAPLRLREVEGIGQTRAARIIAAWAEQKIVREIMIFLHAHGVGTSRAVRIYKTYGNNAVQVMSENPYRLARDIRGIGFKTADAIVMRLGIEKTAMIRVRAGISYALTEALNEGHCGLPVADLLSLAEKLLGVPVALVETAIALEIAEKIRWQARIACFSPASIGLRRPSPSAFWRWRRGGRPGPRSRRKRRSPGSRARPRWRCPPVSGRRSGRRSLRRCLS